MVLSEAKGCVHSGFIFLIKGLRFKDASLYFCASVPAGVTGAAEAYCCLVTNTFMSGSSTYVKIKLCQ